MKMFKYWTFLNNTKVGEFKSLFDYNEKQLQNLAGIKAEELNQPVENIRVLKAANRSRRKDV